MTGREQRRRHIVGAFGRDVGNDAALIFVRADIVDRRPRPGRADRATHRSRLPPSCSSCAQAAFNSGASMPRRRTRVDRIAAGRQMHPRLEGVAVDGPDHIDGMPHVGIAGPPPDHLGFLDPSVGRLRHRPMHPLPDRQHRTRGHAKHEHPRQQPPKTGGARVSGRGGARYAFLFVSGHIPKLGLSRAGPARTRRPQKSEAMPLFSQSP